jgi:hypothetical protein
MLPTKSAIPVLQPAVTDASYFFLLRGRAQILRMHRVLVSVGQICDQRGVMDYLDYFLTSADNLKKIPHVVLLASRTDIDVFELKPNDLKGAALVYEYKLLGLPSRIFTTSDFGGNRNVVAPAQFRPRLSALVGRYLIDHGAQVVLLSMKGDFQENHQGSGDIYVTGNKKCWWASQTRRTDATLALGSTVEGTLASLGKHTRRNLRYYRRKAEAELNCVFAADVKRLLSSGQLKELNHASTHPVANQVLERRYDALKTLEGAFCVGVRTHDGQWISLLGGRRHHGVTEIDWQMNRSGLQKYSVGTVVRAYLIEHEISIGMNSLFFEGGTPHSIRHVFLAEMAMDVVVLRRSPFALLLRKWARLHRFERNFLLQTLSNPNLKWELH